MRRMTYRATARKTLLAFDGGKSARMADLAKEVKKSKSYLCRTLKKMVAAGHVRRVKMDHALHFLLTDKGKALVSAWCCYRQCSPRKKRDVVTPRESLDRN